MSNNVQYRIPRSSVVLNLNLDLSDDELAIDIVKQVAIQVAKATPSEMAGFNNEEWKQFADEAKEQIDTYITDARTFHIFNSNRMNGE